MQLGFCAVFAALCLASSDGAINLINDPVGCVNSHNLKRALHRDTPPVTYDASLTTGAQQWAQRLAQYGTLDHSQSNSYGENLYMAGGGSSPATCERAVTSWYNEISKYNWRNPVFTSGTGHFTQVVWKSSTKIGVGIAYNTDTRETYIVVRYGPPGNVQGRFAQNVMPLK